MKPYFRYHFTHFKLAIRGEGKIAYYCLRFNRKFYFEYIWQQSHLYIGISLIWCLNVRALLMSFINILYNLLGNAQTEIRNTSLQSNI